MIRSKEAAIAQMREKYLEMEMPGMVELIDYLVEMEERGTPITTIGSSTIDLHNVLNDILVTEEAIFEAIWFRTFKLHFGNKNVPPLVDIAKSGPLLEQAPMEARKKIDEICRGFAQMAKAEPAGDVESVDKDGVWRIPKDEYMKWKKDPSYQPKRTRIERLSVDKEPVDIEEYVRKLN